MPLRLFRSSGCFALFLASVSAYSQTTSTPFQPILPLTIEPSLSGNYGELRPNHFHAGLDYKTAAQEGLEVRAVSDGYVSRIKISSYGYGKIVYITHPEGYTTAYAHLSVLKDSIYRYVRKAQYEQESFEVEVFPGRDDLPVKRGDVIALSGNTGGSGGPHLHFEVRETSTEVPRNPMLFGFSVADALPPVLEAVAVVTLSDSSRVNGSAQAQRFRVKGTRTSTIETPQAITVAGPFGIQVRGYDQHDGASNQNGIFKLELSVDGQRVARFVADSIPFDQSRYLNALIDYDHYYANKSRFVRMYRLPGNLLENIDFVKDGQIELEPGEHTVKLEASDANGNMNTLNFRITAVKAEKIAPQPKKEMLPWNKNYLYESELFRVFVPKGAMYRDEPLHVRELSPQPGAIGPSLALMREQIPLHVPVEISIRIPADAKDIDQLLLAQVSADGKISKALMSRTDGEFVTADSKSFGYFKIVRDASKPVIEPVLFKQGMDATSTGLKFKASDNMGTLQSFRAEVNGKWVLAEYEHKQNLLYISPENLPRSQEVQLLQLQVWDMVGNVATFEGSFIRK